MTEGRFNTNCALNRTTRNAGRLSGRKLEIHVTCQLRDTAAFIQPNGVLDALDALRLIFGPLGAEN